MTRLKLYALYFMKAYSDEKAQRMDEMKLHKLLYFSQKESYAVLNRPLFEEDFYGWKYGPVLKEIRALYHSDALSDPAVSQFDCSVLNKDEARVLSRVFKDFASLSSWSLSSLSHAEFSWKQSRKGVNEYEASDYMMKKSDIRKDALYLKFHREYDEKTD